MGMISNFFMNAFKRVLCESARERYFHIPGDDELKIDAIVTEDNIKLILYWFSDEEPTDGDEFAFSRRQMIFNFEPEAYKRFWKKVKHSDNIQYKILRERAEDVKRMRFALNYVLNKYESRYGRIFN